MQPVTFSKPEELPMSRMSKATWVCAGCLVAMLTAALHAQQFAAAPGRLLEGGWVRLDTSGSGNFGGPTAAFARAALTPEGAARVKPQRDPDDVDPDNKPHKAGEPYIVTKGQRGVGGRPARNAAARPGRRRPQKQAAKGGRPLHRQEGAVGRRGAGRDGAELG